ncbi:hypothetical protein GBZ26_22185 [Azospirillum formosense]|uniref:Uncharacterized protein n=1 Tax=Azospirillum formosense TaxID=861533 RepID=A0ABX2L6W2_9PROT|nr:hypothetical protein [Azospirillum formosense]
MAQRGGAWRERFARCRAFYFEGMLRRAKGTRPVPGQAGDGPCACRLGSDLPPPRCQWITGSSGRR